MALRRSGSSKYQFHALWKIKILVRNPSFRRLDARRYGEKVPPRKFQAMPRADETQEYPHQSLPAEKGLSSDKHHQVSP